MPISLPYLAHLQLPTHHSAKLADSHHMGGFEVSLDLLEAENLDFSEFATRLENQPSFGLVSDPFCPYSFSFERIARVKHLSGVQSASETQLGLHNSSSAMDMSSASSAPLSTSATPAASETRPIESAHVVGPGLDAAKREMRAKHYSQNSRLSEQQHRLWWSSRNALPQSNVNDPLKVAVAAEQRLYKESMKRMVLATCAQNFAHFAPPIAQCLDALYSHLQAAATQYSAYYTPSGAPSHPYLDPRHAPSVQISSFERAVPTSFKSHASSTAPSSETSSTHASKTQTTATTTALYASGSVFVLPHLTTPPLHSVTLPRAGEFWIPRRGKRPTQETGSDASGEAKPTPTFLKQIQPPVSVDGTIRALLGSRPCSIVISASTLACIASSSVEEAWEIPVSVEEVFSEETNHLSKVVFIDKPLVSRDLSIKQKNTKFYKMSIKRWLLQHQKPTEIQESNLFDFSHPNKLSHSSLDTQGRYQMPNHQEAPDNFVYSEWRLGDLSLMVRQRIDALTPVHRTPDQTILVPTVLASKMKHVPDHHLEEFSPQEKAKYMLKTHLLGTNARFLVGHVDPLTARLESLESLTHQQLRSSSTLSLEYYITQLYDVLAWCKTLQPGQFLLSHASGEHKISAPRLFEHKDDVKFTSGIAATYNLHERQREAARTNYEILEYLPPRWDYHRINQIPNTFPAIARSCCYDFIKNHKCGHPESCQRVHISLFEAEIRGLSTPASALHQDHPSQEPATPPNDKKRRRTNSGSTNDSKKRSRMQ